MANIFGCVCMTSIPDEFFRPLWPNSIDSCREGNYRRSTITTKNMSLFYEGVRGRCRGVSLSSDARGLLVTPARKRLCDTEWPLIKLTSPGGQTGALATPRDMVTFIGGWEDLSVL